MAYVITRLCRDCVDGSCVDVCPVDCILEHRPASGTSALPRQLFIDPNECISCNLCVAECPWEAIYEESEVPGAFLADVALNAQASVGSRDFHVPTERLRGGATREQAEANYRRWLEPDDSSRSTPPIRV